MEHLRYTAATDHRIQWYRLPFEFAHFEQVLTTDGNVDRAKKELSKRNYDAVVATLSIVLSHPFKNDDRSVFRILKLLRYLVVKQKKYTVSIDRLAALAGVSQDYVRVMIAYFEKNKSLEVDKKRQTK